MYFGGFTLNTITFGGLALGIGMLVDSAIVVLENIYRHRESGLSARDSALKGTQEVWSAIVASTLTTLVVFFPVNFIRGMSGIMFSQMAFVVSFSLLCSLVVALTLIPMLSAQFLHYQPSEHRKGESKLHKIYATVKRSLTRSSCLWSIAQVALVHRKKVVSVGFGGFSSRRSC